MKSNVSKQIYSGRLSFLSLPLDIRIYGLIALGARALIMYDYLLEGDGLLYVSHAYQLSKSNRFTYLRTARYANG